MLVKKVTQQSMLVLKVTQKSVFMYSNNTATTPFFIIILLMGTNVFKLKFFNFFFVPPELIFSSNVNTLTFTLSHENIVIITVLCSEIYYVHKSLLNYL